MAAATPESDTLDLPVIELKHFLESRDSEASKAECKKVADALYSYGLLCVRDPRATASDNDRYVAKRDVGGFVCGEREGQNHDHISPTALSFRGGNEPITENSGRGFGADFHIS
jgi:hypothetical protein